MRLASLFARCLTSGLPLALATLVTGGAAAAVSPALPTDPAAWRSAAVADIEEAVRITRENHPGPHDPHNPGFTAGLEAARGHGLALAARVRDGAGYRAAIAGFNARIGDGHAGVFASFAATGAPRWPGFVTVWRGDALYVHSARDGQPAPGSKLLDCDGKAARALIDANVFAFRGRADEAGQWWSAAPRLFIDERNPFLTLPRRCRFTLDGQVSEHTLAWHDVDGLAERWLADSRVGAANPVGITEPRKNMYWVAMPTFQPDEMERAAYRAMVGEIARHRPRYLAADAVVVDLRGNQGGSSQWSLDFAKALFGAERVLRAMHAYGADTRVWWRASPDNTAHVGSLVRTLREQGSTESAAWAERVATGMRAALARGELFHVEERARAQEVAAATDDEGAPFSRPLYVVVPGYCASACLDALDVFTRFPNTVLVGAPSSGDSTYMDVRVVALPSTLAQVIVPNKVYVGRPRTNGQVYQPHIPVTKVNWSQAALREAIEADLARRR